MSTLFLILSHIRYTGIDVVHHPDYSLKKDLSPLLESELGFDTAAENDLTQGHAFPMWRISNNESTRSIAMLENADRLH